MTWLRIDDRTHSHPKVLAAGNAAFGLWVRCAAWSCDHLTDGFVPRSVARLYGTTGEIRRLLDVGLWVEVSAAPSAPGPHFHMPDFLEFNRSREEVLAERAAAAERQRRSRRARARNDDPHLFEPADLTDLSRRDIGVTHTTPTRPDPTPVFKSYDDDKSVAAEVVSSSLDRAPVAPGLVDSTVRLIAESVAASANPERRRAFVHGTLTNLRAEHLPEISRRLAAGEDPLTIAADWCGSHAAATVAAAALNHSTQGETQP